MNSTRISIFKTVLMIIFREVSTHANITRLGKGSDIAMAHCRSLQGSSWFSNDGTRNGYKTTLAYIGMGLQGRNRPPFPPAKSKAPRCGQLFT